MQNQNEETKIVLGGGRRGCEPLRCPCFNSRIVSPPEDALREEGLELVAETERWTPR